MFVLDLTFSTTHRFIVKNRHILSDSNRKIRENVTKKRPEVRETL